MKAVVYKGKNQVAVEDVPNPKVERSNAEPGTVFGHENQGVVEEVGKGVVSIKRGDRGQAEFLRVPFADFNCLKLPGQPGDQFEDDFVLLADIFPTGWHATELASVRSGDAVAVFGPGPVGQLSAYSALINGAAEVYVVDRAPDRLRRAEGIGAVAVDFTKGDPVEQIRQFRAQNKSRSQALRPGEEKMAGVNCAIDAVGYQAVSPEDPEREDPMATIRQSREITIGQGQAPVKKYNVYLRDLIMAGKAKPSFIVSHHLPLSKAVEAYAHFDKRGVGAGQNWTKVLLKPHAQAA